MFTGTHFSCLNICCKPYLCCFCHESCTVNDHHSGIWVNYTCICLCACVCMCACVLVSAQAFRSRHCASHVGERVLLWIDPGIPTISCQIGLWALCALLSHGPGPHDGAQKHILNGSLLWEGNGVGGPCEAAATAWSPWVPHDPELDRLMCENTRYTQMLLESTGHIIWLSCLDGRLLTCELINWSAYQLSQYPPSGLESKGWLPATL